MLNDSLNAYLIDEIKIGDNANFSVTITEEMMKNFLNISGDFNPLHVDKAFATNKNFKGRVVYGMLTSSFYSKLVGVYLPGKYALLQSIDIKFKKPVYINDELFIYGEIIYINEPYKTIEIKAFIKNHLGEKVSTAKIMVGLNEG